MLEIPIKVKKLGSSKAVIIPKIVCDDLNIQTSDTLILTVHEIKEDKIIKLKKKEE